MTDKKARFLQAENEVEIEHNTVPEFLILYQKAVLLALKEQGAINDLQCQLCIDRLTPQLRKSAHWSGAHAGDMIPANGDDKC
ncbi:MAG: hypothetical protein FWE19_05615 [Oscillospiraceae bacterium]|nr:hypothetical protein [Oscillospiraceae bacterium]